MESVQIEQLLKLQDVVGMVRLKRAAIYRQIREGSFPRGIKLGERAVAWKLSEVQEWIETRARA